MTKSVAKEMKDWFGGIGEVFLSTWDVMVAGSGMERGGGKNKALNRAVADSASEAIEGEGGVSSRVYAGSALSGVGGGSGNFAIAESNVQKEQLRTLTVIADNTRSTSHNTAATKDAPKLK